MSYENEDKGKFKDVVITILLLPIVVFGLTLFFIRNIPPKIHNALLIIFGALALLAFTYYVIAMSYKEWGNGVAEDFMEHRYDPDVVGDRIILK